MIERPQVGRQAPDIALPASDGTTWRLGDHLGRSIVVIFHRHDH